MLTGRGLCVGFIICIYSVFLHKVNFQRHLTDEFNTFVAKMLYGTIVFDLECIIIQS